MMFLDMPKLSLRVFFLVVWLAGLGLSVPRPLGSEPPPAPPALITPEKQGEMKEIRLTEIQDGEKKWVLTADNADYLKAKDKIYLKNIWVEIFGQASDTIIITGEAGYIGMKSRDLTLEGNVRARSAQYEFSGDLVHYDPQTRTISAPGPVTVAGPRLLVEGQGLTIDLKKNTLAIARHKGTKLHVSGKLWNF